MTKFKIGDRVRRKACYINHNNWPYGLGVKTITSIKPYNRFCLNGSSLCWTSNYFELVEPTTFEIGKTYKIFSSVPLKCIYQEGEYFVFIGDRLGNNKTKFAVLHHNSRFEDSREVKPEDWRCLHYSNNIASLGGESFLSKEEVEKKFSSSPNFIKAVRVDA